jgi:hypothetical protein
MTAPKSAAERQRARTARLAAEGLKPVRVIGPVDRESELKAVAARMVEDHPKAPTPAARTPTPAADL